MLYIIMPVKNERRSIRRIANETVNWCYSNLKIKFQILIINDHSTDGGISPLEKLGYDNLRVIHNDMNFGKGSALRCAYAQAKANYIMKDDDLIMFLDGDGQIDKQSILTLLYWVNFAPVVIGNKRHPDSEVSYTSSRVIVSKTYNWIVRKMFNTDITDTQCGIKIFNKYALDKVIDKLSIDKFAFDLELIVSLEQNNFRIISAPIIVHKQLNFGSVNIKSIIQTFYDTIKIFKKYKKGFYKS